LHEAAAHVHVALLAIHSTLHLWYSQYSFDIGIKLQQLMQLSLKLERNSLPFHKFTKHWQNII